MQLSLHLAATLLVLGPWQCCDTAACCRLYLTTKPAGRVKFPCMASADDGWLRRQGRQRRAQKCSSRTCTSGFLVPFRSYSGGLDLRGLRSKSWADLLFCCSLPAN